MESGPHTDMSFHAALSALDWQVELGALRKDPSRLLPSVPPPRPLPKALESAASARLLDAIDGVFESLPDERLDALVKPVVGARHVWVISGETSQAGAQKLYTGLSMLRSDVRLVTEQEMGRELVGARSGEVAIVIDFSRYRRHSITATKALAGAGVTILAITDGPLSPLAQISDAWVHLKIPAVGPFDSSVPAVVAAELIVARTAVLLGDDARERIDRLESLWQATGTFFDDARGTSSET